MSDPGDLDGDGKFDAIDIAIMENGEDNVASKGNAGCCVMLFLLGSIFAAGLVVGDYLT